MMKIWEKPRSGEINSIVQSAMKISKKMKSKF